MAKTTFATIGILAVLLLSLGIVSAGVIFSPIELTGTGDSGTTVNLTLNIENDYSGDLSEISAIFSNLVDGSNTIAASNLDIPLINDTTEIEGKKDLDTIITIQIPSEQAVGTYKGEMNLSGTISSPLHRGTVNITLTVTTSPEDPTPSTTFCPSGDHGHLEIVEFDVINNGKGDDDEWEYLDEIEIEVTVENTGNDNINDVFVEIEIRNDDNEVISKRKIGLDKDEIDLGRIRDDDEETVTFKIDEVPIDLENGDYRIYAKAYEDGNENEQCKSTSEDFTDNDKTYFKFEIVQNDGATVIVKEGMENIQASCGDKNAEVKFMIYNTGNNDEEKVLVMLENSVLGIEEKLVINNLRDKKNKEATFYITIPKDLSKTFYELDIYTYYDYDDDEDELDELIAYGESSLEEGDGFSIGLEILSCEQTPDATISIDLESETIVQEQVIIKATITNNGKDNDFAISTSDLESWAELITISLSTTSIKEGESAEIIITFIPTATGEHTFKINAIADGQPISKTVIINIDEKPSIFSNINNTTLYIIAGIIAVLIIIFLALIVRVSRRQVKPQF